MQNFFMTLMEFFSSPPVVYLAGVAFTACAFTWMKSLIQEYRMRTEWPYILIILINGTVPMLLSSTDAGWFQLLNPAVIVMLTPIIAILEFAILTRDKVRIYIFFVGMIMLQFACLFGIGATIITAYADGSSITSLNVRSAALTATMFLLAISFGLYAFFTRKTTDTMRVILHNPGSGLMLVIYMVLNGLVLGFATAFDYSIYFTDSEINPLRTSTITGMILRYVLIYGMSIFLIAVQYSMEVHKEKATVFEKRANTDPLTGLLNRSGLEQLVKEYMGNPDQTHQGALFLLDLDHFKEVNDTLGHPVGDELLKKTAKEICGVFRDDDWICRMGGDEFCVFLRGDCSNQLLSIKARKLNDVLRHVYQAEDGKDIVTTASIGIAAYPVHGATYDALYESADTALYHAKERGRDCFELLTIEDDKAS